MPHFTGTDTLKMSVLIKAIFAMSCCINVQQRTSAVQVAKRFFFSPCSCASYRDTTSENKCLQLVNREHAPSEMRLKLHGRQSGQSSSERDISNPRRPRGARRPTWQRVSPTDTSAGFKNSESHPANSALPVHLATSLV